MQLFGEKLTTLALFWLGYLNFNDTIHIKYQHKNVVGNVKKKCKKKNYR